MEILIASISTAFVVVIGAMFAGFLKLTIETRKILNGSSEKRSVKAAERHGEMKSELKTMTTCMRSLNATGKEQTELLRELINK